jgi:hypothetical protein
MGPAAVSRLLQGVSLLLALLFLQQVLLSLAPLHSGPLALALSFGDALITQAPMALLVPCLLALAESIDERSRLGRRLARLSRLLAVPVAIGYLLLIPLYGSALWSRSHAEARTQERNLQGSLERLEQARSRYLQAGSSPQRDGIRDVLPAGSPPLPCFGSDLPSRHSALVDCFDQVHRILALRRQGVQLLLLERFVAEWGLFSSACLGLALLFRCCCCIRLPLAAGMRVNRLGRPASLSAQTPRNN